MASANDMKAAEATYAGFIKLFKFGAAAVVVVVAIVIALIA
ncbi:MAG: aa3-type cytochrome c oxidase subunit IV [Sphingomonadales bacterium]|nr:aa3-type cytochrome c oxidase subunit IV [Sphingomonadales bacterium]